MTQAPSPRKPKAPDDATGSTTALAADARALPSHCQHCGDPLAGLKVVQRRIGAKLQSFCCQGCAFIAEQLYLARASSRDLAALDAALGGARRAPAPTAGGALKHEQIEVHGMVCGACALLIEHRLRHEPGVASAHVDFGARRAYVAFDPKLTSAPAVRRAVEASGYRTSSSAQAERKAHRVELLRVLLAWLAMMQVMMLAVPAYVAAPGDIPPDIEQLLRIAQLVLTVPVMLFSAAPLFRAAASQIRARAIGMDLPIVLGLTAAFAASAHATVIASGATYYDSITMFVALVMGSRWLQARALARAYVHIDAAHRQSTLRARRLRAYPGSMLADDVPAQALVPGDHVVVAPGVTVPADGVVARGVSTVSQAWLTGEAAPVEVADGAPVLAGSVNLEQPLVLEVTRAGEATSLAALRRLVDDAGRQRPRIVETANRVAVIFLWAVLAITAATVVGWWIVDPAQALPNAIAVLVATCPCALSLAAPAALAAVQSALADRGVLTARASALEQLARIDAIATDKTGTLTEAEPALLRTVLLRAGVPAQVLAVAAALESLSAHPFARALTRAAHAAGVAVPALQGGRVEPSAGVEAVVDGVRLRLGKADYALGIVDAEPAPVAARLLKRLEREKLQAASVIVLADSAGPIALFAFGEAQRPDAQAFVDEVRAAGIDLLLVSGDRREPVANLARALAIAAPDGGNVYAHQTPDSKRQLVAGMQRAGRVVAMLGDGMNDAPVIAQADVSIALAEGSTLAQARADFIVLTSRLADIAYALRAARRSMRIVRQNLGWALAYNLAIIPLAAFGYVTPAVAAAGMAASSLAVVANALRARRQ